MTTHEAVQASRKYLTDLLPEFEGADVVLEEAEVRPSANAWKFTFCTTLPVGPGSSLAQLMRGRRIAKVVEIDPDTGDLLSVKNAAA